MARLASVLPADALGHAWLRSVLTSMLETDAAAFLVDDGPGHTKHVWIAGRSGLHHTVIEKDPARPGYFRPMHRLHPWPQVHGAGVDFEGLPNNVTDWIVSVTIAEPPFARTAANHTSQAQWLIDFGLECARLAGGRQS